MTRTQAIPSAAQRIEAAVLSALLAALRPLPYGIRSALGGALMAKGIAPLAGYRRRARTHLAQSLPDLPPEQHTAITDAALSAFGRELFELFSAHEAAPHFGACSLDGPGLAHLHSARAAGRPAILLGGHFGNPGAAREALNRQGFDIGWMYRPLSNPLINARYCRALEALRGPSFARGRAGTAAMMHHLRGGGMMALLFDQWAADGVPIPFLGRPAQTTLAPARIALRLNAPLLPYRVLREGTRFAAWIDAPLPATTPEQMMTEATRWLEAQIRAHPEQYFWVHRRWKPASRA